MLEFYYIVSTVSVVNTVLYAPDSSDQFFEVFAATNASFINKYTELTTLKYNLSTRTGLKVLFKK